MSRPVRARIRSIALLFALALGFAFLAPQPAQAGGPTSVLISSPSTQTTGSLYATSPDYDLLLDALGGLSPRADPEASQFADTPVGPGGNQVNVTWLIHDVSVWRVDRIVTDDSGDIWVHTEGSMSEPFGAAVQGGGRETGPDGVWHRSPHPEQLRALLDELGVPLSDSTTDVLPSPDPANDDAESVAGRDESGADESADTRAAALTSGNTSPLLWALPSLAVGIAAGIAADRRLRLRRVRGW
ncbi:hypothetical protein [Phytoactinopolyspora endophytica]|uniref:hypothetical protein n=1 Tax=Phytoactinopolyspora endophytica TaxID=1642495 RepID=UPI00101CD60C|nr:hypothetical protein [Phytoactinopolyspora endophytica]